MDNNYHEITVTKDYKIDNIELGKQKINKFYDLKFEYDNDYFVIKDIPESCTIRELMDKIFSLVLNGDINI